MRRLIPISRLTSYQLPTALAIGLALEMIHRPGAKHLEKARQSMVHVALKEGCSQAPLHEVYDALKGAVNLGTGRKDHMMSSRVGNRAKELIFNILEREGQVSPSVSVH